MSAMVGRVDFGHRPLKSISLNRNSALQCHFGAKRTMPPISGKQIMDSHSPTPNALVGIPLNSNEKVIAKDIVGHRLEKGIFNSNLRVPILAMKEYSIGVNPPSFNAFV